MNRVFVDTNTLVYADQTASRFHSDARSALARLEREDSEFCISRQVLREYLAAITRPSPTGAPPMTRSDAADAIEDFAAAYVVLEDGPAVTERLLDLIRRVPMGGKQVHDANIVATMLSHDITRLLTFDLTDFRRFADVIEFVGP